MENLLNYLSDIHQVNNNLILSKKNLELSGVFRESIYKGKARKEVRKKQEKTKTN